MLKRRKKPATFHLFCMCVSANIKRVHTVNVCLITFAASTCLHKAPEGKTDRPVGVVAASRRLLQPHSAELLEAEVEAEGRCLMLGSPRASAGLPVEYTAALLTSSSGLILKHCLVFSVTLLHHLENMPWFNICDEGAI